MEKKTHFILYGILLLSILLHAWRLPIPSHAMFDEVHYATYAADYRTNTPFFDVHPPLGKFIYSIPLIFLSKESLIESPFIEPSPNTPVVYKITNRSFSRFPYIPLRITSAFFGTLLVLSVFLFIRELTKSNTIALLSAFFVTLENSILVETRFIFLDGIFLTFSFLALWQFLKQKDSGVYSGILWGCTLATKLVGIIFLPFILFQKVDWWKKWKFVTVGFFTLGTLWIGIQLSAFPTDKWYEFTKMVNTDVAETIPHIPQKLSLVDKSVLKSYLFLNEISWSTNGYTTIQAHNPSESKWFEWPFMIGSFCYGERAFPICLIGNPALWGFGFLAVLWTILYIAIKKLRKQKVSTIVTSLFLGYASVLLPFAIIPRYKLIWQYFPALIFSLCLAAYWIVTYNNTLGKRYRIFSYILLLSIVCLGFLSVSPTTFGIR
ncbi:MAG: phospholipid carrier-dependent glycosyltransferase [Candidatus Paceibacterota bacterium]|jgi:dolichyl-phosphate-mannose--protein O-mannosyl transferase